MLANFEQRDTSGAERVWTGRYRNLHNLPHWHLENELICVERGTVTVSHNHRECTCLQKIKIEYRKTIIR